MIRWWIAVLFFSDHVSRRVWIRGDGEQTGSFFGDVSNYFAGSVRVGIRDVTAVSGLCTPARAFVKRVLCCAGFGDAQSGQGGSQSRM
jgi:hypothetical protein